MAPLGAYPSGPKSPGRRRRIWAGLTFTIFVVLAFLDTRPWDSLITGEFQQVPSWPLYRVANAITIFGSLQLTGALVCWAAWAARRRSGASVACWIVLPFLGLLFLEPLLKVVGPYIRPGAALRPGGVVWAWFRVPPSYSFPSGHMLRVTYLAGLLLTWEAETRSSPRRPLGFWSLTVIALAVFGISQVYLGNHWASDVAGGFFLGASWALTASPHWKW